MIPINNYIRVAESEIVKGVVELNHQIDELRRQKAHIDSDSKHKVQRLHSAMLHNLATISKEQNQQAKAFEERALFKLRSEIKNTTHDTESYEHKIDQMIRAKEDALRQMNSLASSMRSLEANPALR